MPLHRGSKPDALSQDGFDSLLALLDPDRDQAGLKYETLRRKLRRFFEWRDCHPAEELVDETLDRVARKLAEGLEVRLPDPGPYVYGVARNVAREAQAERGPHAVPLAGEAEQALDAATLEPDADEMERALHCLDRCLEGLPARTRQLLLVYHGEGRGPGRDRVLKALRITPATLWVRMHRLRKQLERCVRECLASAAGAPLKGPGPLRHPSIKGSRKP